MRRHDQRHLGRRLADTLPNLEAARHERYSVLVGATGSKSPHADILRHGCPVPFGSKALAGPGLGCLRLSGRAQVLVCQLM